MIAQYDIITSYRNNWGDYMDIQIGNTDETRINSDDISNTQTYKRNKGKSLMELPDDYTLLDLETTGYGPYSDIIEVAMVKIRANEVLETFQSLVKPPDPISDEISELTGISNNMLTDAPAIEDIIKSIQTFLNGDIIVAHNANFDINLLYDAISNHLEIDFSNDFVDTLRIARKAYPQLSNHRLSYLAENIPLENKNKHRALSDCFATYELLKKCKSKIISENISLKSKKHKNITSDIRPINEFLFDVESPLYGNECVFTGTLSRMLRIEAMQHVANIGGTTSDRVTKNTKFLIMGLQDYSKFVDGNESFKTKVAKELAGAGQDIHLISEAIFYDIISTIKKCDTETSVNEAVLIQGRISELGSGIIDIHNNKIRLTGFLSPERLHEFLNGTNCFFSFGLYPNENYNESVSKDDALFIVRENNIEIKRWLYQKRFESSVILKIDGKLSARVIKVFKLR